MLFVVVNLDREMCLWGLIATKETRRVCFLAASGSEPQKRKKLFCLKRSHFWMVFSKKKGFLHCPPHHRSSHSIQTQNNNGRKRRRRRSGLDLWGRVGVIRKIKLGGCVEARIFVETFKRRRVWQR